MLNKDIPLPVQASVGLGREGTPIVCILLRQQDRNWWWKWRIQTHCLIAIAGAN